MINWPDICFPPINLWSIWKMSEKDPLSPCIGKCKLHPELQVCTGCGRTDYEVELWSSYTDDEKIYRNRLTRRRLRVYNESKTS